MRARLPLNPAWAYSCGPVAHAWQFRYEGDTRERTICGASRYLLRPADALEKTNKCLRCLRLLGLETPELSERVGLLNAELRLVHMQMRKEAKDRKATVTREELRTNPTSQELRAAREIVVTDPSGATVMVLMRQTHALPTE